MSKFKEIIGHVLDVEGGSKYSNHPADKGGPTKWGITQSTLSAWLGKRVSANDVKNLTKDEAIEIYKARYWDVNRTSDIESDLVARVLFDQSVNRGQSTAAKMLQTACNRFPGSKLVVDGKVGNLTINRTNTIHDIELANALIQEAQDQYVGIVKRNNSQLVFLAGWINRTQYLMDAMAKAKTTWPKIGGDPTVKPDPGPVIIEDTLFKKIIARDPEINRTGLSRALSFLDHSKVRNKNYMAFVNFDINSRYERMWVIDLATGVSEKFKVAHGRYSDMNHDGFADKYSNVPGSGQSSLGAMVMKQPYGKLDGGWSKFKTATKIEGIEPGLNDKVESRAIVFHNSAYVNEDDNSLPGRSLGCFAVDDKVARRIQAKLQGGALLYSWDKDFIK